jgi:predicted amidohydrolase
MDAFTVTVGQLVLSDPQDVYDQIGAVFVDNPDTDLFVFPEFATQHNVDLDTVAYLQESPDARVTAQTWLDLVPDFQNVRALSDELGKAMLIGCIAQDDGRLFSRAYFYDPRHKQLASYDKSHVHWTEDFLRPGATLEPIQTRFGKIGILMCYDMAFAEAARVLGIQGADVLFALSAIPIDFHWRYAHRRMIGAAIFNQYYVVAANLGCAPEAPMGGYSGIYGPKGDLIAQVEGTAFEYATAEIDLDHVRHWREREIIYPHRRPHLYRPITAPMGNGAGADDA